MSKSNGSLQTPSIDTTKTAAIAADLNALLADTFTLYLKTKNFHWHMTGPHFRDYHLMLDEQAEQIFAMTDDVAERVRKIGQVTLHSIGEIGRTARLKDSDSVGLGATAMLSELYNDHLAFIDSMHKTHELCDEAGDVATASLLENWIDEGQRRAWFLFETLQPAK